MRGLGGGCPVLSPTSHYQLDALYEVLLTPESIGMIFNSVVAGMATASSTGITPDDRLVWE